MHIILYIYHNINHVNLEYIRLTGTSLNSLSRSKSEYITKIEVSGNINDLIVESSTI